MSDLRCHVCGADISEQWKRCTNRRCLECHRKHCTPLGVTDPGHGYGSMPAEMATCDGCGEDIPVSEIASVVAQGVEGDFCERCRGIPAEQDPADHHLEQLNEMRLERERDEDEWDRLNFEAEIEETERELGTGR